MRETGCKPILHDNPTGATYYGQRQLGNRKGAHIQKITTITTTERKCERKNKHFLFMLPIFLSGILGLGQS